LSFFDKLSLIWDRIGQTATIHAKLAELFPKSADLQKFMCEYLIVIVNFCHRAVAFLNKPRLQQLAAAFAQSFDQHFKDFEVNTERWAAMMNGTVTTLLAEIQIGNKQAISSQYGIFSSFMSSDRQKQSEERRIRLLRALSPSQDEFESIWRREQKKGSVQWVFQEPDYKTWKSKTESTTLIISGVLGSGKTVLMANLVRDLHLEKPSTCTIVASFFCQHQNGKTLDADVVLRSIAHQILRGLDIIDTQLATSITAELERNSSIDLQTVSQCLKKKAPTSYQYFVAIDALDECKPPDREQVIRELRNIANSLPIHIALSARNRSEVANSSHGLPDMRHISMANTVKDAEIAEFVDREITTRGAQLGLDTDTEQKIKQVLVAAAQGMYLWVVLQLDALFPPFGGFVSRESIVGMLENLPKDLSEAYNRAIARIHTKRYGSQTFQLVAAAKRPLTVRELRVALNITPGTVLWNPDSVELNPHALIWQGSGGLLEIDESNDTVLWIHHSALMHLIGKKKEVVEDEQTGADTDSALRFDLEGARLTMSMVCITYLNLDIHDRRVQVKKPKIKPEAMMKVINEQVASQGWIAKAVLTLTARPQSTGSNQVDIGRIIEDLGQLRVHDQSTVLEFLPYAQEFWLTHTEDILRLENSNDTVTHCQSHFRRLLQPDAHVATKPWATSDGRSAVEWAVLNNHWSVFIASISEVCLMIDGIPSDISVLPWLLDLMKHDPVAVNPTGFVIGTILCWAAMKPMDSDMVNKVIYFLDKGADPDFLYGWGNAPVCTILQLTLQPSLGGHKQRLPNHYVSASTREIKDSLVRSLLAHGANPNGTTASVPAFPLELAIQNGWFQSTLSIIDHLRHLDQRQFKWNSSLLPLVIESFESDRESGMKIIHHLWDAFRNLNIEELYYHPNHVDPEIEGRKCPEGRWPTAFNLQKKPSLLVAIAYEWWDLANFLVSTGIVISSNWNQVTALGLAVSIVASKSTKGYRDMLSALLRPFLFKVVESRSELGIAFVSKTLIDHGDAALPPLAIALRCFRYYRPQDSLENEGNDLEDLKDLIKRILSVHPKAIDEYVIDGISPLGMVTEWCHLGQMKLLLELGADPNQAFNSSHEKGKRQLPLLAVIEDFSFPKEARLRAASLLLEHGASITSLAAGLSVLGHAIHHRDLDMIRTLCDHAAEPLGGDHICSSGHSPLGLAIAYGDAATIRLVATYMEKVHILPYDEWIDALPLPRKGQTETLSNTRYVPSLPTGKLINAIEDNHWGRVSVVVHALKTSGLKVSIVTQGLVRAVSTPERVDHSIIDLLFSAGAIVESLAEPSLIVRAAASSKLEVLVGLFRRLQATRPEAFGPENVERKLAKVVYNRKVDSIRNAVESNNLWKVDKTMGTSGMNKWHRVAVATIGLIHALESPDLVDQSIIDALLQAGVDAMALTEPALLIRAADNGRLGIVATLLRKEARSVEDYIYGTSPIVVDVGEKDELARKLLKAIDDNSVESVEAEVRLLPPARRAYIATKGLVRAIDRIGAVDHKIVDELMASGADARAETEPPLLIRAIAQGKLDIVSTLLENKAPVRCKANRIYHTVCMAMPSTGNSATHFGTAGRQYVKVMPGDTPASVALRMDLRELHHRLCASCIRPTIWEDKTKEARI
jgi:ankyrin repeat protein